MIQQDILTFSDAGVLARKVRRIYLLLLLFCSVITCGGCATRNARSSSRYTTTPHSYPATRYALRGEVAAQWCDELVPESKSSGWLFPDDLLQRLLLEFGVGALGYTYSLIVEVPISLVTDTVLLPLDIRRIRAFAADEEIFARALFGEEWPVSAETLRAHYHGNNCGPLIQRLLGNQDIPHRREKILCLIKAGVGLEQIAAYDELDAEMAENIMAQVAVEHPMRFGTLNILARNPLTPADVMIAIARAGPYSKWSPSPMDQMLDNPSISSEVLDALSEAVESPSLLIRVARHHSTSPATLDRIAQRNIAGVNRVIAAHPSARLQTLTAIAAFSPNDPEIDAALAENPGTLPEMLHRIVKNVSHPLLGKWILRDVSLHPAANDEIWMLILEACDRLDQHPAAREARDVIDETRKIASERINRENLGP